MVEDRGGKDLVTGQDLGLVAVPLFVAIRILPRP
jgi:hypothetical protein